MKSLRGNGNAILFSTGFRYTKAVHINSHNSSTERIYLLILHKVEGSPISMAKLLALMLVAVVVISNAEVERPSCE